MIKLSKLVKIYNKGKENERIILDHVDLEIRDGEMVAIVGKSGAGKSTLLQILAGMADYDAGEYYFDGALIKALSDREMARFRNEKTGIVLQDFVLIDEFTALENVILPLEFSKKHSNRKGETEKTGIRLLKYVGLKDKADQVVATMSGGEKQRVAIARALANNTGIIFADEPTGALDIESTEVIMHIFHKLHERGKTVVIVTHDADIAKQCERVLTIREGAIWETKS